MRPKDCLYIFFSFSAFLLNSCNGENKGDLTPLAKVYDKELYYDDVKYLFDENMTSDDSALLMKNVIDQWVNKQILLSNAENEIDNTSKVDLKVKEFKNDLLIHEMYSQLVQQNVDTSVSETELLKYYKEHKEEFLLKDYLVKVLYLKVPADIPDISKLDRAYRLKDEGDVEFIKTIAQQYALNFYYDTDSWIYFEELTKEIPLRNYNTENLILNKTQIKVSDENVIYYLNIIDSRLKDALSPFEFEKENIRKRIFNKRILNFKKHLEDSLIKKAYDENKVNIL